MKRAPQWMVTAARRFGGHLIVWAHAQEAILAGRDGAEAQRCARREIDAIAENIKDFIEYQKSEAEILNVRLSRRYDPGMALNEAANRAVAEKKAARKRLSGPELTPLQKKALAVQQEYLQRIVDRS